MFGFLVADKNYGVCTGTYLSSEPLQSRYSFFNSACIYLMQPWNFRIMRKTHQNRAFFDLSVKMLFVMSKACIYTVREAYYISMVMTRFELYRFLTS